MFTPPIAIPPGKKSFYRRARLIMYLAVILIVGLFTMETLFPTIRFSFDFRSSGVTRNPLLDPRSPDSTPIDNGRLPAESALITNLAALGTFAEAEVRLLLDEDSPVPENLQFEMRRSYRSFFFPIGEPVKSFPEAEIFRVEDIYYELRDGVLFPFVSADAFLSRYPEEKAQNESVEFLARYPVSESWRGYRIGSLLAFADGVFVVTSETEARPIGSADIFLGLGYRFEDVIAANSEEVGIYERGRIFLLGAAHPDGTIFFDTDTKTYYLIENGTKRELSDPAYRDFLLKHTSAIAASSRDLEKKAMCQLVPRPFGGGLGCHADTSHLQDNLGNDYEVTFLGNDTDLQIRPETSIDLDTAINQKNLTSLISKIKIRILSRFGYANIQ